MHGRHNITTAAIIQLMFAAAGWSMREFSLPLVATPELWRKYDLEAKPQFKSLEEPNQFHYSSKIHFACF